MVATSILRKSHLQIPKQFQSNVPQLRIPRTLNMSSCTVLNIIKRLQEPGEISVCLEQGRKSILDA